MACSARQKSFIDAYKSNYLLINGLTQGDLLESYEAQQAYNNAIARYVSANPQIFDREQIESANIIKGVDPSLDARSMAEFLSTNTTFDWLGLGYVVDDGLARANDLNPFAALNMGFNQTLIFAGIVVISAVIAYKVTPKIPQT